MISRFMMCAALAAACLLTPSLHAGVWVTDTAEFQAAGAIPVVGPPIQFSHLESTGQQQGAVYTNTFGTGGFVAGNEVRTVGAALITEVAHGPLGNSTVGITTTINDVVYNYVMIFAIHGEVFEVNGSAAASFHTGKLQLALVQQGTFNAFNPTTWGFDENAPAAQYSLADPAGVISGEFDDENGPWSRQLLPVPGAIMNISAVNLVDGADNQGRFLVVEDPSHGILNSDSGQAAPDGYFFTGAEGLYIQSTQTIILIDPTSNSDWANRLAVLNSVANWGLGDGVDFATNDGNGTYAPGSQAGDFLAGLSLSATPVIQAEPIPEPGTLAIWGLMAVVGGGIGLARRRK